MTISPNPGWLTPEEMVFDRLAQFHRQRVEAIATGQMLIGKPDNGMLVVHLMPEQSAKTRLRFDAPELKKHGSHIGPLGERGGYSRFNVDGWMQYDGSKSVRAYTQLFRDGRIESVMSDVSYQERGGDVRILRDTICERAIFSLVAAYLKFCKAIGLEPAYWLFLAIVGCEGVRINRWHDFTDHAIDRQIAYLPEMAITSLEVEPQSCLRPLCDALWQAVGEERSWNYDQDGKWSDQRRR